MTGRRGPAGSALDVLVVVNDLQAYGSQRVALRTAEGLAGLGCSVRLVTLEPGSEHDLPVPSGVPRSAVRRPAGGPVGYASLIAQLSRVLARHRPRTVLSHMMFSNVVTLAATRVAAGRRRVVVTEHNRPSRNLQIERSGQTLERLCRRLYPGADAVIGVSDAVVDDTRSLFGLRPGLVRRVYNPVDVAGLRAGAWPVPHPWLAEDARPRTMVCVAGFRRAKGQDVLIRALACTKMERVIFVGGGDDEAAARALADELGVAERCAFVGYRDDAPAFMAAADALVVPSRWEGFGLVAVEAAALGTPVIASEVSGLTELLPERVPGVLVPPEDPEQLAAALRGPLPSAGAASLDEFEPRTVAEVYRDALFPDGA